MSRVRSWLLNVLRQREFSLVGLILLLGLSVTLVDDGFLGAGNITDILVRSAPTIIVACGAMLVVVISEAPISRVFMCQVRLCSLCEHPL